MVYIWLEASLKMARADVVDIRLVRSVSSSCCACLVTVTITITYVYLLGVPVCVLCSRVFCCSLLVSLFLSSYASLPSPSTMEPRTTTNAILRLYIRGHEFRMDALYHKPFFP